MFNRLVKYFLENRLITFIFLYCFCGNGIGNHAIQPEIRFSSHEILFL